MVENKRYVLEQFPVGNRSYAKCWLYKLAKTFRSFYGTTFPCDINGRYFKKWFLEKYCFLIDLDCRGSKQASTRELGGKLSNSLFFPLFLFPFMIVSCIDSCFIFHVSCFLFTFFHVCFVFYSCMYFIFCCQAFGHRWNSKKLEFHLWPRAFGS